MWGWSRAATRAAAAVVAAAADRRVIQPRTQAWIVVGAIRRLWSTAARHALMVEAGGRCERRQAAAAVAASRAAAAGRLVSQPRYCIFQRRLPERQWSASRVSRPLAQAWM